MGQISTAERLTCNENDWVQLPLCPLIFGSLRNITYLCLMQVNTTYSYLLSLLNGTRGFPM